MASHLCCLICSNDFFGLSLALRTTLKVQFSKTIECRTMPPIGPNIRIFLKEDGLSDKRLDQLTGDTSINLDLGWNGDNFFDDMEVLMDKHQIDFSEFNWSRYVNSEAELSTPHIIYRLAKLILGKEKAVKFTVQKLEHFSS